MEDRKHHTREFKLEAVRLLDQSDRPASEIAVQLGVKRTKYAFIQAHDQEFRFRSLCRVLRVSRSGYYAWRKRPPSPRSQANRRLVGEIRRVHEAARGIYGALKTWRQLRAEGIGCGRPRG